MTVFGPGHFTLIPNREKVFAWLGIDREIPCRQAFERAWPAASATLAASIHPQAAAVQSPDGTLTAFLTLGPGPEERMTALFRKREYVTGSLLNTMSDELLFQMDQQLASLLSGVLRPQGLYAGTRLEPGARFTADLQREKLSAIEKAFPFARISETGILYPTKSMMYVIALSDQPCRLQTLHDCAGCVQKDCPYRDRAAFHP